ncbi:MAG: MFS transporter [Anaerolineales bacterium]|nr:MFS transporter [Anaerolineales bacterium]
MMTGSRSFRLSMFGLLYFVQGAALAYFRNFQKPYLDGLGVDADVIGLLTSLLLLPFILKIFIGMLSDRVNLFGKGHRKPYIILGLVLAAVAFASASFVLPDSNFALFAILIVTGSFSVALFDSTTDGLAIDTTPEAEQGTVQGVMVGGRAAGFIVLSLVFGALVQGQGFHIVFILIAIAMLLPLLWVTRIQEPAARDESQQFQWAAFREMGKSTFLVFGAYAIFYSIVSFGVDGLVTLFLSSEFNAAETTIGQYGALRGLGAIIGAVAGGLLVDRLGRRQSAYGALLLISIGAVLIGAAGSVNMVLALGVVWGIVWGFQETIFVALAMKLADTRIAASMFALLMALSNVGTAVGEGLATGLTDNISFAAIFWLLAGLNAINVPILWGLFKLMPERNSSLSTME